MNVLRRGISRSVQVLVEAAEGQRDSLIRDLEQVVVEVSCMSIGQKCETAAHYERAEIVRQKLEAARAYTQSKPILLVISLHGIKICDDSGTSVHMAHALRRISYATCDPDCCQFAFLAREPKAQPNVQYCHAFVTETPDEVGWSTSLAPYQLHWSYRPFCTFCGNDLCTPRKHRSIYVWPWA
uniref:PID domain-containing protein n=1 Tax=Mesocestoides corti TaxID=53468 RepID=A0A5K3EJ91_MESCO